MVNIRSLVRVGFSINEIAQFLNFHCLAIFQRYA